MADVSERETWAEDNWPSWTSEERSNVERRFWPKVNKTDSCWLWTAGKNSSGYGSLHFRRRPERAHRISWAIHRGSILKNLCVLHNCPGGDNPACVNPDHLFLGTKKDNARDYFSKGGIICPTEKFARGERQGSSKLTNEIVKEIVAAYRTRNKWDHTLQSIASKWGVAYSTVSRIGRRKSWRHVNA